MLREILCEHFNQNKIVFHDGLNVVLGDDDAKNSIGKSTALMIIDFVQGGDSFLEDASGAIKAIGHHHYNFQFSFKQKSHYFSRSTDLPGFVYLCDESYKRLEELPIEEFRERLKEFYGLSGLDSTFRSIVNPFSRIWRKGGLDPDEPFASFAGEAYEPSINRLIDLFGRNSDIASEKEVLDKQKQRKKTINSSMKEKLIPKIGKKEFDNNSKTIADNAIAIERLKGGVVGAISAYEAIFDAELRELKRRKDEVAVERSKVQEKIGRLEREISGVIHRLSPNIALIAEFFQNVNIGRLEQVEDFHRRIGGIIKRELAEELEVAREDVHRLSEELSLIDLQVQKELESKGTPNDLFNRIFELKDATDKAVYENQCYEQSRSLQEEIRLSLGRLERIYSSIFLEIEQKVNFKLKAFNRVVYGRNRSSSELRIKNQSSYRFTSIDDTGTGKSYAGLIGLDVALLSLTVLPFVIHDSVIYKNVEVAATQKIIRILSSLRGKQLFLSFDEAKKFGHKVESLIGGRTVLKLSHNELLYKKDWRVKA